MLQSNIVIAHYKYLNPDLLDIIMEIRNIVASEKPDVTEEIQRWGLVYYDAARGGHVSAGICQILIHEDHIRLAFIHGAFLPDPRHLLVNEGGRLVKRYVRVDRFESAPWDDLKALITASANLDIRSLTID